MAEDEHGHSEQQWQELPFPAVLHGRSHDESATDSQGTAPECPLGKTALKQGSGLVHNIRQGIVGKQGDKAATDYVPEDYDQHIQPVPSLFHVHETGGTGIETVSEMDYRKKSEREQYGTGDSADAKVYDSAYGYAYTGKDG